MDLFEAPDKDDKCHYEYNPQKETQTALQVQFVISLGLGLSAFLAFCILRPRWKSLYAARKRHFDPAIGLPILPDSFFGWIPPLYRITEQQVLASAGLDAYVFLRFFKMSIKLFGIMFFFATAVLLPINNHFVDGDKKAKGASWYPQFARVLYDPEVPNDPDDDDISWDRNMGYLWSYLVFSYFFTGLTFYIMGKETMKVIRVRQDYLGTQSTITDRTFRLSGIPKDLRSEEKIKDLVQKLEIGSVESVTLCRNWKELDDLMDRRKRVLRKLEEAWGEYLRAKPRSSADGGAGVGNNNNDNSQAANLIGIDDEEAGENGRLLSDPISQYLTERERPQARIWYGFLGLQSRKVDAIDYYSERLRLLDDKVLAARKKAFEPADIAFVTVDSIAACQMAIQALIDPHPGRLLTKPAPSPSDVVWKNTYAPLFTRRIRSSTVTIFVAVLTVLWLIPVAFFASAVRICNIEKALPSFYEFLKDHDIIRALVQSGLPTAAISLLGIAVPYLYDFLSYQQGMISQGDIALSVVSKNFFFTFFNIFLMFTVFGAVGSILDNIRRSFRDTRYLAETLANAIETLSAFYTNFIMLQGLGLFPFRLLEFGSVFQYPIDRFLSKTPRDRADMDAPPMFYYGFYLPTALLVFILCLVYSALLGGYKVLGVGLVYFILGYFTYKYQLVYAMDQPQHATGGAWRMICYRVMLGLIVSQITMSGYLALKKAFAVAALIVPLLIFTLYYSYSYKKQFEPLTHFISLRSIKRGEGVDEGGSAIDDGDFEGTGARQRELIRRGSTVDEDREKGLRFINPSLSSPLEQPWIYQDPPPPLSDSETGSLQGSNNSDESYHDRHHGIYHDDTNPLTNSIVAHTHSSQQSSTAEGPVRTNSSSSVSLGDTHIWRDGA